MFVFVFIMFVSSGVRNIRLVDATVPKGIRGLYSYLRFLLFFVFSLSVFGGLGEE